MLSYNDYLDYEDRCRAFNVRILPILKDDDFRHNLYLFKYDFSDDSIQQYSCDKLHNLKDIENFYLKEECGENIWDNQAEILNITAKEYKNQNNVYVAVFYYAPRGSWNPSLFKFDPKTFSSLVKLGESPETYVENKWFSKEILEKIFQKWDHLNFSLPESGNIKTLIVNDNIGKTYLTSASFEDQLKYYELLLVHKDQLKLIKKYYKKHGQKFFIFSICNYLKMYFLFLRYSVSKNKFIVL